MSSFRENATLDIAMMRSALLLIIALLLSGLPAAARGDEVDALRSEKPLRTARTSRSRRMRLSDSLRLRLQEDADQQQPEEPLEVLPPVIELPDELTEFPADLPEVIDLDSPSCSFLGFRLPAFWARGDYLLWWLDGFSVPTLITTSPAGTPRAVAGVLGQPTTHVLVGNTDLTNDLRSGGRVTLGTWLGASCSSGIEASYFGLAEQTARFSPTDPILARPFFNVEPGSEGQDAELASFPGELQGNVSVVGETRLQGAEVLYRHACTRHWPSRIDLLAGWRYNRLDDQLLITDFKTVESPAIGLAVGTTLDEFDRFKTENHFHGAEIGVAGETQYCKWTLEWLLKLALGNTRSRVDIDGSTTVTVPVPGGPSDVTVTPAGLLAQQTNIGRYEHDQFAVIPEIGVSVGYNVTASLRAMVGYSFMYWSRVARPGDQIDLDLNLSQLAPGGLNGIPRPEFPWVVTDMWAQGINFSVDYRF